MLGNKYIIKIVKIGGGGGLRERERETDRQIGGER